MALTKEEILDAIASFIGVIKWPLRKKKSSTQLRP